MTGLLNPKSSETGHFILHDSRCVPRPCGIFRPVACLFLLQIIFLGEAPYEETSEKSVCTSVVARVRSMRCAETIHGPDV